jgi:hypothetical protein
MQGAQGFLPTFRQKRSLPPAGSWHTINLSAKRQPRRVAARALRDRIQGRGPCSPDVRVLARFRATLL